MNEKILLVDDDPAVRRMLFRLLEGERYQVTTAASAREALASARHERPNLTVLDVNLSGGDGWELYQALANEHLLMPIIVVTARSDRTTTMLASGPGALLEKPLDLPKLLWTIRHFLDDTAAVSANESVARSPRRKRVGGER